MYPLPWCCQGCQGYVPSTIVSTVLGCHGCVPIAMVLSRVSGVCTQHHGVNCQGCHGCVPIAMVLSRVSGVCTQHHGVNNCQGCHGCVPIAMVLSRMSGVCTEHHGAVKGVYSLPWCCQRCQGCVPSTMVSTVKGVMVLSLTSPSFPSSFPPLPFTPPPSPR